MVFITALYLFVRSITSPKTLFGREVLFYFCESVILFICLWFCLSDYLFICDQDNSKSSWPIFMKFGRTLGYYEREVKFEFDKNCFGRTRTSSNRKFSFSDSKELFYNILILLKQSFFFNTLKKKTEALLVLSLQCFCYKARTPGVEWVPDEYPW